MLLPHNKVYYDSFLRGCLSDFYELLFLSLVPGNSAHVCKKKNKEIQEVYVNNYLQIMTYHFAMFVNFRYFLRLWNQKNDGWCSKRDFYSCGAKLKKFISSKILILKECLQCLYNPSFPFLGRSYYFWFKMFFLSLCSIRMFWKFWYVIF